MIAIARDDDTTFGVLHSRFHELWSLRLVHVARRRQRSTLHANHHLRDVSLPEGLTPEHPAADYADDPRASAIAAAAERLNELREAWLNPPDLVRSCRKSCRAIPTASCPRTTEAAATLKKRTLTSLYNERPAWLVDAHRELDRAVAAAYGWPADLSDEQRFWSGCSSSTRPAHVSNNSSQPCAVRCPTPPDAGTRARRARRCGRRR